MFKIIQEGLIKACYLSVPPLSCYASSILSFLLVSLFLGMESGCFPYGADTGISSDSPVISAGFSIPIISISVGAMSARRPPSRSV